VFTPQVGKEITKMYLMAAGQTLPGEKKSDGPSENTGKFRYTKEVLDGHTAVLELKVNMQMAWTSSPVMTQER
jgi:hypothetical protein